MGAITPEPIYMTMNMYQSRQYQSRQKRQDLLRIRKNPEQESNGRKIDGNKRGQGHGFRQQLIGWADLGR